MMTSSPRPNQEPKYIFNSRLSQKGHWLLKPDCYELKEFLTGCKVL